MRAIFFIFLCITLRPKCCRAQHRQWIWNPSFDVIACEKFHVGKQANGKWTWWTLRAGNEIVVPREWRMECAGYIFFFAPTSFFIWCAFVTQVGADWSAQSLDVHRGLKRPGLATVGYLSASRSEHLVVVCHYLTSCWRLHSSVNPRPTLLLSF